MNEAIAERVPSLAGDIPESFEALYERTFPKVYAYVASLLRDRAAAEDVTSQAFERAYRKRRSYRAGPRQRRGVGVRDRPQRRAGRAAQAQAPRAAGDRARGHGIARRSTTWPRAPCAARSCARRWPASTARERDLVALKFMGGLSNAEIARVVGISESNAGTKLHRTLTKLREVCHDQPETTFPTRDRRRAGGADAPGPDPAFEEELRERVRDGFPRERRLPLPFKLNRPLVAVAASAVLAVAVAVPLIRAGRTSSGRRSGARRRRPAEPRGRAERRRRPWPRAAPSDFAPGRERRIERSASLTLAAPGDRLDRVADGIVTVTERYRGFVLSSSLSHRRGRDGTAPSSCASPPQTCARAARPGRAGQGALAQPVRART